MVGKYTPLICTANSWSHIDYGIPLVANKSTDYRTIYRSSHHLVPEQPQEFDCRQKARINRKFLDRDILFKDDGYKSLHGISYVQKYNQGNPAARYPNAYLNQKVDYLRPVQEKLFNEPPPPRCDRLSEMKDNYRMNYYELQERELLPPAITQICRVETIGRDEQPPFRPEDHGTWKWMDPYLTTNKSTYVPYSPTQRQMALEDLPTIFNTNGKHKGFNCILRKQSGNPVMWDKQVCKLVLPNSRIPKLAKRVPHMGVTSEYKGNYIPQTFSEMSPYTQLPMDSFGDSLSGASPWQNLSPPGMYCTESCHIGTGFPVRSVVDIMKKRQQCLRNNKRCCPKFHDDYHKMSNKVVKDCSYAAIEKEAKGNKDGNKNISRKRNIF